VWVIRIKLAGDSLLYGSHYNTVHQSKQCTTIQPVINSDVQCVPLFSTAVEPAAMRTTVKQLKVWLPSLTLWLWEMHHQSEKNWRQWDSFTRSAKQVQACSLAGRSVCTVLRGDTKMLKKMITTIQLYMTVTSNSLIHDACLSAICTRVYLAEQQNTISIHYNPKNICSLSCLMHWHNKK